MKHLLVFFCFWQVEDIIQSFNSMESKGIDCFVVENHSIRSSEIESFFKTKKLKGYIQLDENIAYNALNIFNQDYRELLDKYDIISYTDGDLYFINIRNTYKEILSNLKKPNVMISSANVFTGDDYYKFNNPQYSIVGIDEFRKTMRKRKVEQGAIEGMTGLVLVTLKKESLFSILNTQNFHFRTTGLDRRVSELGGKWTHSRKNLAYHLTWDHYTLQDEYYIWKVKELEGITPDEFWDKRVYATYRRIV